MPRRLATIALLVLVSSACGSSRARVRPTSPFEPIHERFFDNSADFISEQVSLGGQWASDWDEELRGRVGYADTIALVKVETLRTSIDVEHHRTYHLLCTTVGRLIRGALPEDDRIEVSVAEGSAGFETIARNERRLVEGNYLLFIKWAQQGEEEQVVPRWHLSPATDRVRGDVTRMINEAEERGH